MNILLKVSIVIPVYNGANYMREAIDSALAQTYGNVEVIVINDGSNDNGQTEAISLSYNDRIRYFSKPNGGVASALNMAIREMEGEYFSWLSHDDIYYPNKIEHQVNILNSLIDLDTIIYSGFELINEKSKTLYFEKPENILPINKINISFSPLLRGLIHGCTLLIPTKYFYEIGFFNETLLHTQDYELWFKFFKQAPVYCDSHILVKSRIHKTQDSRNQNLDKVSRRLQECNELWISFLKNLSEKKMIEIEGSSYLFLSNNAIFLENANYTKAAELANSMAANVLANIKISIIIPIYNRINRVIEAIDSVLVQTHANFELLLIDERSTEDNSLLIEKCEKDSRIIYIRKENKAPSSARNVGVQKASGKYIAFLDPDDLFESNKLEVQLKYMEKNAIEFSYTSYNQIDIDDNSVGKIHSRTLKGEILSTIIASYLIATSTVMGKASLFKQNPFPEHIKINEDKCLWISIASMCTLGIIGLELSKIRIDTANIRLSSEKEAIGFINIAYFVANHEYLNRFSPEIVHLLLAAAQKLNQTKPSYISTSYIPIIFLIRGTIQSLRVNGIRETLKRIYSWLRARI